MTSRRKARISEARKRFLQQKRRRDSDRGWRPDVHAAGPTGFMVEEGSQIHKMLSWKEIS